MSVLVDLKPLFFPVSKQSRPSNPPRYWVQGTPPGFATPVDYDDFKTDFPLVTYEDAVKGGLVRCKLIFGLKAMGSLKVHRLGQGRRLQWFEAQLCETAQKVTIAGADHYPVFSIRYEYDHVTYVKFDLGVYRSRCSNGLIFGYKELARLRVKATELWKLDTFFWQCLWQAVLAEYERGVHVLRATRLTEKDLVRLVAAHIFGARAAAPSGAALLRHGWGESGPSILNLQGDGVPYEAEVQRLSRHYSEELQGPSAYVALNVITDLASNYIVGRGDLRRLTDARDGTGDDELSRLEYVSAAVFSAQRKAGVWLSEVVEYLDHTNQVEVVREPESDNFGRPARRESYEFSLERYLQR